MKILVIGSGGREHAICCQFLKSSKVDKLYCAPGNGGTSRIATNVNIQVNDASCFCELVDFVKKNKIDFTFVGPEVPLSLGIVDYFKKNCLEIIGPSKNAAKLESSKIYSKEFMKKYNIPTAFYNCFFSVEYALDFLRNCNANEKIVVKADGLAAGKGVYICENKYEATNVIDKIMNHKILGSAGNDIIIEKYIKGIELSCLVFTDGMSYSIMPISHDYKKINDHDEGVNTGGMGAYAPVSMSIITDDLRKKIEIIIKKVINGINAENIDYNGVLYVGLII
ncbi:MAG: phosphoribosylamine--glycine ligase, partial [Endomicrobium sp.]|nr:phosphoribosylamine--glycine ligase [Endomicrobium sp.]